MPPTPDSLFGLESMGRSVELFKDIEDDTRLQRMFESEECYADVYRYDKETYEKALAPFTGRAATSKEVKTQDKGVRFIGLLHVRIHKKLYSADLFTQRAPGEMSDNAAALVMRTRQSLRNRLRLTIERLCAMVLRGTVTITAANFPDTEIEGAGYSNAVTALNAPNTNWSTPAAPIVKTDAQAWKRTMRQASGMQIERLIFNRTVTGYLLGNTEIKEWIAQTQQKGVQVFEAANLGRAGGIPNWEEYEGFYKPEGGSATPFISDNEVFALPRGNGAGLTLVEGFGEIPAQAFGVGVERAGIAGAIRAPAKGIFEFATPIADGDPPGIKVVTGWYGIPIAKLPEAIGYRADVTSVV